MKIFETFFGGRNPMRRLVISLLHGPKNSLQKPRDRVGDLDANHILLLNSTKLAVVRRDGITTIKLGEIRQGWFGWYRHRVSEKAINSNDRGPW